MSTVWDVAKEIELEGKKLYESQSLLASGAQLAGALTSLAQDEQRHYEIVERLEKESPPQISAVDPTLADVTTLLRLIAAELKEHEGAFGHFRDAEFAYRKALVLEHRSIEHYTAIAASSADALQKNAIERIIAEEQRHVKLIDGLIEFVRRPKEWLEDAEIYHVQQY